MAVVFMSRMEGNETVNEGLCLKCAKELGIPQVSSMMDSMGITLMMILKKCPIN